MNGFDNIGKGLPTLGNKIRSLVVYARRQSHLDLLRSRPHGGELVEAVRELVETYDRFVVANGRKHRVTVDTRGTQEVKGGS